MLNVPVLLGSVRRGRMSDRVARHLAARIEHGGEATSPLLDLRDYDLPVMEERLGHRDDPPPHLQRFAAGIEAADALVVVAPEYNRGYPGALKNALDYLWPEFNRKPFGLVTVSAGGFGGFACMGQLQQLTLGLGAFPVPTNLPVSNVEQNFAEDGTLLDAGYDKRIQGFIDDLLWYAAAIAAHKARVAPPGR